MNRIISIENLPDTFSIGQMTANGKLTRRIVEYTVKKYIKEKKLMKIKRGLYSKVADPFYVASMAYKGYIGFSSALYLYGLKTETEATILVCTPKTQRRIKFLDKIILPVNMSDQFFGYSFVNANGLSIPTATFMKTVFDMFYRPKYANYYDLYKAINGRGISPKEWEDLFYYAKNSNLTTMRRLGYGLEGKAPGWFTGKLMKISKNGSRTSFFFLRKPINYNAKWDIFDDINVRRWKDAV